MFFRNWKIIIYFIALSDSDDVIAYLLACGLERGSHTFQHSSDLFLFQCVNFITEVNTFLEKLQCTCMQYITQLNLSNNYGHWRDRDKCLCKRGSII